MNAPTPAPGLLPQGFHDRLPPDADAAAIVEQAVLGVARLYGYERVDPPLAEFADTLETRLKRGSLRDAVRFVDPVSQATLAIRPDITVQVARVAATRMGHHPRPVRLSYAGPVLKLRASELAPARALRQVGCELIGLDTVAAAREVAAVAVEGLAATGARDLSVDFTLPDLVDVLAAGPMPVADGQVGPLRERLDAKDAGGVAAIAPDYHPLLEAAGPLDGALDRLRALDRIKGHAKGQGGVLASRLDGVAAVADGLPARLTLDPTERHGFAYQSWLGFSLFADGREVGRGGTYQVVRADGSEEPATGFTLYADALLAAAPRPDRRRLFLPHGTPDDEGRRLRAKGWVTVAALDSGDTAVAQLATHVWQHGEARLIDG